MRLAVLWKGPSGYINACIDALGAHLGDDLLYLVKEPEAVAPFESVTPAHSRSRVVRVSERSVDGHLDAFAPDVLLVSGWDDKAFMASVRSWHRRVPCLLFMDNQWLRTPKQVLGIATSTLFVRKYFDGVMVPGERQVVFARMLGFPPERIITGGYSCDTAAFTYQCRTGDPTKRRSFLACNRMVSVKGVDDLLRAYDLYRSSSADPWDLVLCGVGPELERMGVRDGVRQLGFVQPKDLPEVFRSADALVLASHFEPWGVVVHEAVSVGLPVICTTAVGAGVHLVAHGANGYVVPPKRPDLLAGAMSQLASQSDADLATMGQVSRNLSSGFSPRRWAANVMELCDRAASWSQRELR